jgi:phosphoribosylformylglycinamidine synthase
MKTRVYVTLKNGVLDPQGKAIHHALEGLGFGGINEVRAGKLIELDLDDRVSDSQVEEMCRKLLANTVIENFRIENEEARIEPSEGAQGDASRGDVLA